LFSVQPCSNENSCSAYGTQQYKTEQHAVPTSGAPGSKRKRDVAFGSNLGSTLYTFSIRSSSQAEEAKNVSGPSQHAKVTIVRAQADLHMTEKHLLLGTAFMPNSVTDLVMMLCICPLKKRIFSGTTALGCARILSIAPFSCKGVRGSDMRLCQEWLVYC
jgi:hypothetical protein